MTIKIPLPRTKSPLHMRGSLSAFMPAARSGGPEPILPQPIIPRTTLPGSSGNPCHSLIPRRRLSSIFVGPGYTISGRGTNLAAFYATAPATLPARSVFRGMGRFRHTIGDFTSGPIDLTSGPEGTNWVNYGTPPGQLPILPGQIPFAPGDGVPPDTLSSDVLIAPTSPVSTPPPTIASPPAPETNPALDQFNQALSDNGLISKISPPNLAQLSNVVGAANPAQLATLTQAVTNATPGPSLTDTVNNWLKGTTSLGGYTVKNSTLIFGGAATIAGLAVWNMFSGGKKRRK